MNTRGNRGPLSPNRLPTSPSVENYNFRNVRESGRRSTSLVLLAPLVLQSGSGKSRRVIPLLGNENPEVSSSRRPGYGNNGIPRRKLSKGTTWDALDGRRNGLGGSQDTGLPAHENQSPRKKPPMDVGELSIYGGPHGKVPVSPFVVTLFVMQLLLLPPNPIPRQPSQTAP